MTLLKIRRFWRTSRPHVVGILVCFCALGLVPAGYGQTDRVSQLIDELKDKDSNVRETAAGGLGKINDARTVEAMRDQETAQSEPKASNSKLNSDFLRAIRKGDVKKISALAEAGADINRHGSVVDVEDVDVDAGGFRYRIKSTDLVGASEPMMEAMRSYRLESVRALLALGADVKSEFFVSADIGPFPFGADALVPGGPKISVPGKVFLHAGGDGVVISSILPTPARKATYLSVVERWLTFPRGAKERRRLQQIEDLLRQAMGQ